MSAPTQEERQEKESVKNEGPLLCTGGCGFWGNPVTGNMCSVCYKKASISDSVPESSSDSNSTPQTSSSAEEPLEDKIPKQEDPTRCWSCKRKVGLTGIACKCTYVFCGRHRYPEEHDCTFDFRKMAAEQLERANPAVRGNKGLERLDSLDSV